MKILRVKGDRLLPVQNGGNMRSLHFARRPAQHHSLTFFPITVEQKTVVTKRSSHRTFRIRWLCLRRPAAAELAAKYDWPAVGARFGEVLQQLVGLSKETLLST